MRSKIQILCPEYVPLENKGEEAIIRGVIDILFPNGECEYHIVDNNSKTYYKKGDLHVHPGSLFFSKWRSKEFGLGLSWEQIYSSMCSILRNSLNIVFPQWIKKPHKKAINLKKYIHGVKKTPNKYKVSVELLKNIDYVIAGHNGGLNEYVCHILNELSDIGIPFGIFGSSLKPKVKQKSLLEIYEKTLRRSDFNIIRNPIGFNWALNNFPDLKFELHPDPAFGMTPESDFHVNKIIKNKGLESLFNQPVIMITTAEPAPIARYSFDNYLWSVQKIEAHRIFLSNLLRLLHSNTNCNILFLPHTIGPEKKMDDRLISKDIIMRAYLENSERIFLLEDDLSAKELKGLIKKADFLIAERLHSIIGAIGVETPFMSLASTNDIRVEGILKQQMNQSDKIYYLNRPNSEEAFNTFKELFDKRLEIKIELQNINAKIKMSFESIKYDINSLIRSKIKNEAPN